MIEDTTPGEHYRLKLVIHKAVAHTMVRMERVGKKKNRLALEQEFREWIDDPDQKANDIQWMDGYEIW